MNVVAFVLLFGLNLGLERPEHVHERHWLSERAQTSIIDSESPCYHMVQMEPTYDSGSYESIMNIDVMTTPTLTLVNIPASLLACTQA